MEAACCGPSSPDIRSTDRGYTASFKSVQKSVQMNGEIIKHKDIQVISVRTSAVK